MANIIGKSVIARAERSMQAAARKYGPMFAVAYNHVMDEYPAGVIRRILLDEDPGEAIMRSIEIVNPGDADGVEMPVITEASIKQQING